jgi:uncharacterized protein
MRKKIILALLLFISLLAVSAPALASETQTLTAGIEDSAQILNTNRDSLEQMLQDTANQTESSVFVVTTNNGTAVNKYAKSYLVDKLSDSSYVNSGVIMVINMNLRKVYVYSKGNISEYLSKSRIDNILDQVQSDLKSGDYDGAARNFLTKVQYYHSAGLPKSNKLSQPLGITIAVGVAVILGIIVSLTFSLLTKRSYAMKDASSQIFYDYQANGELQITGHQDILVNSFITSRPLPRQNDMDSFSSGGESGGGRSF